MPSRSWQMRIEDILDAIERIQRYTEGLDFGAFRADGRTLDAVLHNFEVIGEAANHVPDHVQQEHAEVPWDKMRGMRNVLIHEYFAISVSIVWYTITHDLPPLVPLLRQIIEEHNASH